jgi:hypothetical protein
VAVAGNIGPTLLDTLESSTGRRHACPRSGCWSCPASSSMACHRLRADGCRGARPHAGPPGLARQPCRPTSRAKARDFRSAARSWCSTATTRW